MSDEELRRRDRAGRAWRALDVLVPALSTLAVVVARDQRECELRRLVTHAHGGDDLS